MSLVERERIEGLPDSELPLTELEALCIVTDSLFSWRDSQQSKGLFKASLNDGLALGDLVFSSAGHEPNPTSKLNVA